MPEHKFSIFSYMYHSYQFYSGNIDMHFPCRTTWSGDKIISDSNGKYTVVFLGSYCRHCPCPCLRSLLTLLKRA